MMLILRSGSRPGRNERSTRAVGLHPVPSLLFPEQTGAAVLPELQADLRAGGRPRSNTQHQGSAAQVRAGA